MSKGSPSMVALLGLMAVAGYQNRDKLSSLLRGASGSDPDMPGTASAGSGLGSGGFGSGSSAGGLGGLLGGAGGSGSGGVLDELRQMAGGAGSGGLLGGLSELLGRFSNPDHAAKAQSWVGTGPNSSVAPNELENVLDEDTLSELVQKTGLDRQELLHRLSAVLPDAVDQMTPEGQLPNAGVGSTGSMESRGTY